MEGGRRDVGGTAKGARRREEGGRRREEGGAGGGRRGYGGREKALIAGALEILRDRGKEEGGGKEGVIELIEQKKEMFLVSMSHGILENEIERLKMINAEKQEALEQSRKMLDKDREDFARHFENNKLLTEQAQHVRKKNNNI